MMVVVHELNDRVAEQKLFVAAKNQLFSSQITFVSFVGAYSYPLIDICSDDCRCGDRGLQPEEVVR